MEGGDILSHLKYSADVFFASLSLPKNGRIPAYC